MTDLKYIKKVLKVAKKSKKTTKASNVKKEEKTEKKEVKSKPKFEFNLEDDFTYHDVVGLFILFFVFIGKLLKIIFWPVLWVGSQNKKLYNFIRADGQSRVMNEDERLFFESVPIVFILTGLIGGLILGLMVTFQINVTVNEFFSNLKENFVNAILNPIANILSFIWYEIIIGIGNPIFDGFKAIFESVKDLYQKDPYLALFILVFIGFGGLLFWITLNEKLDLDISDSIKNTLKAIFGTPSVIFNKALNLYQKFNRKITEFLIGKDRLDTRTQEFFKKSLKYTVILSVYTFLAGIYIGLDSSRWGNVTKQTNIEKVAFSSIVLIVAGLICGTIIFALITRYFDLLNRKKYISPEFIKAKPGSSENSET